MKRQHNYRKFSILICALLAITSAWGQRIEKTTNITKHYAIDESARIEVSNKYGNMHIHTWEKDSAVIKIEYTISAKDSKRYNRMKSSIDFEFVETTHYVIARTKFLSSGKEIFRDLSAALTNSSSSSITVNYELFVPEYAKLSVTNKYGDVYTANLKGDVSFDLAYGTFKAHNFDGHTTLTLNNCNSTINKMEVGIINLSYGDLLLDEGGSIKLNSRSSKARIHTIGSITVDGKSDQINVEECGKANVTGNFSKFEIDNLSGKLNASTKYGNMDIYLAENHNGDLMINSKYTDIILRLYQQKNKLNAEIRHQRSKMAYPSDLAKLKEEKISGNDVIYHSSGTIGNGTEQNSKFTLIIESGDFSIFSR